MVKKAEKKPNSLDQLQQTTRAGLTQKDNWDYVSERYL